MPENATKTVQVLSVPHTLQGPNFNGYVNDPSYLKLLKQVCADADFVFEECGDKKDSHAEQLTVARLGVTRYRNLDPPDRKAVGIPKTTGGGGPIDYFQRPQPGMPPDCYESCILSAQQLREEYWVKTVLGIEFKKAVAVVGLAHTLSFTFRLQSAGVAVRDPITYTPYHHFQIIQKC